MTRTAAKHLTIQQDQDKPVERVVLADAILKISKAAQELRASGLNRKGVIVLLAHSTGLGQTTVRDVLDGIEQLRNDYCTK